VLIRLEEIVKFMDVDLYFSKKIMVLIDDSAIQTMLCDAKIFRCEKGLEKLIYNILSYLVANDVFSDIRLPYDPL